MAHFGHSIMACRSTPAGEGSGTQSAIPLAVQVFFASKPHINEMLDEHMAAHR
jgi:hypothetical protein